MSDEHRVTRVYLVAAGQFHDIEVEDSVSCHLEWANGATGVFVSSTGEAPGTNRFEIVGTRGRLVMENEQLTLFLVSMFALRERSFLTSSVLQSSSKADASRRAVCPFYFYIERNGKKRFLFES